MKTAASLPATQAPAPAARAQAQADQRPATVAQRQALAALEGSPRQVAQRQAAALPARNTTGLPDQLKAGVESLSGHSFDDVSVHYNSPKPAEVQAHAYAQGADIHLAPGQEQHLPHEAWHVAQQKQGRVRPTMQLKGLPINDNKGLEYEADVMGQQALHTPASSSAAPLAPASTRPGTTRQRVLNGYADANAFITTMQADSNLAPDAQAALRMPEVIHDIQTAANDPNLWEFHKTTNPSVRMNATDKGKDNGKLKMQSKEELVRWLRLLADKYLDPADSATGYAADHSARVSITEPHDKNWLKFVDEHLRMLFAAPVDATVQNLYQAAYKAAEALDNNQKSLSAVVDPAPHLAAVHAFAAHVNQHKGPNRATPLVPTWKTESRFGTGLRAQAHYVPGSTFPKGSGKTITTPLDWFYSGRLAGTSAHYVKGHLLNDHVGGPALNYNLSPLEATRNKEHEGGIEHFLKYAVRLMTQEWETNKPPTFERIEYTTELGPQTGPRAITLQWEAAQHFWLQQAGQPHYLTQPLKQVLLASNVPDAVRQVAAIWPNLENLTMGQSYQWINTMARLLETEDILVRDWNVHLLLTYTGGRQESHFTHLANGKQDGTHAKDPLPATTAPVNANAKVQDTSPLAAARPTAIKMLLGELPQGQLNDFRQFVAGTPERLFDTTNLGQIEQHPAAVLDLWHRYQEHLRNKSLLRKKDEAIDAIGLEVSIEVINELAKRVLHRNDFDTIYKGIFYLHEAIRAEKEEQHIDRYMRELGGARRVVEHRAQLAQAQREQAQREQAQQAQAQAQREQAALAMVLPQGSNVALRPQLGHAPEQPVTPVSVVLNTFKDLLSYQAGQQLLGLAQRALQLTGQQNPLVAMSAWSMLLGRMQTLLQHNMHAGIPPVLAEGEGLLRQAEAADANAQQTAVFQDLQNYIPYLAQLHGVTVEVVVATLNDPNPDRRQGALQELQKAKQQYQQQQQQQRQLQQ